MARVLIAAGGTGGHVYPALALGRVLRERGHEVTFAGGTRVEAELVPEAGFPLVTLPARGLPRRPSLGAVAAGLDLARAVPRARDILRRRRIDVVAGMGGYPSLAPCLAAGWGRRARVVLHEQNAILSLANRLAARWASTLALSLPLERPPARARTVLVGNPVRDAIRLLAAADAASRAEHRRRALASLGLSSERATVLAFGGSLGARPLNETLPAALSAWAGRRDVQIVHLAGREHAVGVRGLWTAVDLPSVVLPYLDTIEDAYAAADLAVCRAGASTVAELTAVGLPAVLVPLPFATAGHQDANARALERGGAAIVVGQPELGLPRRLREAVESLAFDRERRLAAAAASRALGRPDAAERLAEVVEWAANL